MEIKELTKGCPKRMLNGPCGGQVSGSCEVARKNPCVWIAAYQKLKAEGKLAEMMEVQL